MTPEETSRPPLDRDRLDGAAAPWTIDVLDVTASTNAVVTARAGEGADEGLVVVAEHQTAGRGRLDRTWVTPAGAALTFSVLLRPSAPERGWPWLTLLAGLATTDGVAAAGGPRCGLKWPNDVMHDGLKLGGLLAERVGTPDGPAVVLGIGLNVTTTRAELPVPAASSLLLAGMTSPDRTTLLVEVLSALRSRYAVWQAAGGAPGGMLEEYARTCVTIGQQVRVSLPHGGTLTGTASGVTDEGALVVESEDGRVVVSAGDVVHVRTPPGRHTEGLP